MSAEEALRQRLPTPIFTGLRWAYNQRPAARAERRHLNRRMDASRIVFDRTAGVVQRGPFQGVRFPSPTPDTAAKCVGTYEREIYPAIEALLERDYSRIVNIGCAEGFYAVGLAHRKPRTRVDAFDIAPVYQQACRTMAALNAVEVNVAGECGHDYLARYAAESLAVVDCEGCEDHLLDPSKVPALRDATILVELHDTDHILDRFCDTHHIEVTHSEPRTDTDAQTPELRDLPEHLRAIAVFERPDPQAWAVLTP